jgi:exodeoxyribonuclease V alpha subunit
VVALVLDPSTSSCKTLNPPGEIRIERFGWTFCPSDKVMQVENDYDKDVYNGDLGVVSRINMEEGELHADFDGREVTYGFGELDELVLAYATTIHKAKARSTRLLSSR